MNATDQQKLLNAGFTIIRRRITGDDPAIFKRCIYAKTADKREWFMLESNFPTAVSLTRRMAQLLTDEKTVED